MAAWAAVAAGRATSSPRASRKAAGKLWALPMTPSSLTLLGDGVTGVTGGGPIDAALSRDSQFLYTLNGRDGTISAFQVGHDGSLTPIAGASGLPAGSNGLAAR